MGMSIKEFRKVLGDIKEEDYYIEKKGSKLLVWLYKEEDCRKLSLLPYTIKEINKLGEFPAKYLVSRPQPKKHLHMHDTRYGRARCMDLSKLNESTQ